MTVGNTMIGIKTILACPGNKRYPELHQKISKKQDLLWDDILPASVQEEIVPELIHLRAMISRAGPDIEIVEGCGIIRHKLLIIEYLTPGITDFSTGRSRPHILSRAFFLSIQMPSQGHLNMYLKKALRQDNRS